jgi:site-specific recombinase XerD
MTARAKSHVVPARRPGGGTLEVTWPQIIAKAPVMAKTMASYLDQLEVSARPGTVAATELALRFFAHRVTEGDPSCVSVAGIGRAHIEDYKLWLKARRGKTGKPLATMTIRHRMSTVRTFFERIMEWDYDDAPARLFIYMSDLPALDEPLPRFLDDPTAAKFMATLAQDPNLRRRLMVELLARTGMRVGELAGLEDDAMVQKGDGHRLRIPLGKLHNDRYVPLLPMLVDLIGEYKAVRGRSRSGHLLERDDGLRSTHRAALCRHGRTARRYRPRPSASVASHVGNPVDQPRHEPRSDRRVARSPFHGHDPHLCTHLRRHGC